MRKFLIETAIEIDIPEEIKDKNFIKLVVLKKMIEVLSEEVMEQVELDLTEYFIVTNEEMAELAHIGELNQFTADMEANTNFAGSVLISDIVEEGALDMEFEEIG